MKAKLTAQVPEPGSEPVLMAEFHVGIEPEIMQAADALLEAALSFTMGCLEITEYFVEFENGSSFRWDDETERWEQL